MHDLLVVGPRDLDHEWAEVWIDTGAGPGFVTRVPTDRLSLASIDDGNGDSAIYRVRLTNEEVSADTTVSLSLPNEVGQA